MYVSLHQLIQPYLDTSFDDLPDGVQQRVMRDFFPHSWARSSPSERSSRAQERDAELDPAMSAHAYWFALQSEILGVENEIADFSSLAAKDASTANSDEAKLTALKAKLAVLCERWRRPDDSAAKAQLATEMAALGQVPAVMDISRALQFLAESTGTTWTETQLLSLVSNTDIYLYAAVPPWTPMYIVEWKDIGLRQRPFVKPGRSVLVELSSDYVKELWVSGQTGSSTWVSKKSYSVATTDYVYLENPVTVLRSDIRLTSETLLQILKKWEGSRQPIAPIALPSPTTAIRNNASAAPVEVLSKPEMEIAQSSSAAPLARSLGVTPEWVIKAREAATEYIDRHRANNLYPSLKDVCDHVEGKLRANGVLGAHGKPVSATYIGRNALQGEWWKANKP